MSTTTKHKQRSQRSHNKKVDFTRFHRNAAFNQIKKEQRETLMDKLNNVFHRTANK